ncbi:hypothetical protein [Tateyamaria sp.]|uniref:hypothetical protein n=1 Tax=Tateyamaria sp. TaxID=1929288 RepID=UPI00329B61F8
MALLETRKRGRPRKSDVMDTLAVRLPDELVARIDAYVDKLRSQFPGLTITRADAVRQLLISGLEAFDNNSSDQNNHSE